MHKTGLALGSGAARGLAHIGVLKALQEENVDIDMIAGSSIGALVGACYATSGDITFLEEIALKVDWKQMFRLTDPNFAFLFRGAIHGKKVKELLKSIIGDIEFKDLKIPLSIVATDANTCEEIVIHEGSVVEAVRASISIPAIFMPVKYSGGDARTGVIKERYLIDGGIVNPIPIDVVKDMGATFVIACNVINDPKTLPIPFKKKETIKVPVVKKKSDSVIFERVNNVVMSIMEDNADAVSALQEIVGTLKKKLNSRKQPLEPQMPNMFETIARTIMAMEYELAKSKVKDADIVITPDTSFVAPLEFFRGKETIAQGYTAARNIRDTLCKIL
ncbi:MAG: patatin-like phospholipase family protein [Candidatus Ancaeobacter aquaticus]|nr:patatin-like phospholipase family protein [Candidatus Ancaeobacter aquaticus]